MILERVTKISLMTMNTKTRMTTRKKRI